MDVQFEIVQGRLRQGNTAAGVNRFRITMRRFIVGSAASCHLVCKSRTISDRHCVILIENGNVLVRDLGSETGTFVNDVPVAGTELLRDGDKLRIGRLEFKLLVTGSLAPLEGPPTPPATPVELPIDTVVGSEVARSEVARSEVAGSEVVGSEVAGSEVAGSEVAGSEVAGSETVDTLVTDLLQREDEAAREARYADPAARYFRADQVPAAESSDTVPDQPAAKQRPVKKSVGKLPSPPPIKANDSVSAAEQALQELFHPAKGTRKR